MKLSKLIIKNLRGLESIEIDCYDLTSLIGKNNCGKSSILRAIELLCSGVKPEFEEFYLRQNNSIEIEGVFDELKDWERQSQAISGAIYDNKLHLKYVASISEDENHKKSINVEYYAFKQDEEINGWNDKWGALSEEIKAIAFEVDVNNGTLFTSKANKEKVKQKIRDSYTNLIEIGEVKWSNDSIAFNNSLQQAIPKIIIIPAVRDAIDETKYSKTGKSAFGELMKKIILPQIQAEVEYENIIKAINNLSEKIHSEDGIDGINKINTKLSDRLNRLINAKANVKFDNPEIETVISSGVGLRIIDGLHDTPIGLQGHGLQRTLIFSLLEIVAENEAVVNEENNRTTIILYEEPELYLHPQMLRKLKSILTNISSRDSWQIICSTHSPTFINVAEIPESLVLLSRDINNKIIQKQLKENPFEETEIGKLERDALRAALDFHPTVCEVFFADNVVLVEGDTEMAILKHCNSLLEYCEIDVTKSLDCSIVSCGGKWTIPALARLLNKFQTNFKIVHDIDRHGKNDAEILELLPIHPYRANERIASYCPSDKLFTCDDTIEDLWNGKKSDKPYAAIVAIKKMVEDKSVPEKLKELITFVYKS